MTSDQHDRHPPLPVRRGRGRSLNRGDILLLLCGVLGFFALTFLPDLLSSDGSFDKGRASKPDGIPLSSWTATPTPPPASEGPAAGGLASVPADAPVQTVSVLPTAARPTRIAYPLAGIDVAIHPLEPSQDETASRTLVPPLTMDGYWLTPFGVPGAESTDTTYIIGHSWEDRDAPFNHLSSASAPGQEFEVTTETGTVRYRVDSITTYLKDTLKDSPIWEIVPNRMVLISCYTEDPWGKNVVVVASPVTT
jgi:hypothetical protein